MIAHRAGGRARERQTASGVRITFLDGTTRKHGAHTWPVAEREKENELAKAPEGHDRGGSMRDTLQREEWMHRIRCGRWQCDQAVISKNLGRWSLIRGRLSVRSTLLDMALELEADAPLLEASGIAAGWGSGGGG